MAHEHILLDLNTGKVCKIEIISRRNQKIVEVSEIPVESDILSRARLEAHRLGFIIDHIHGSEAE